MKKIELLAPAGNMESLKAAVVAGCDAVYLGMTNFSARAFAGNFTREELLEAVSYCHVRDVSIYVTMNTMLYETEIENAISNVRFLYEADIDGLLIQDFGLFHLVRTMFPDFDVHTSTQMHVHNLAGVEFMKEQGVQRVVLARETPIEIIREACKMGVDIEIFAYGAICISYSGQCLMSASRKNRSANRGMCAQCCRLKFFPERGSSFAEGDYILSPKDLNVIDEIPQLIEASVTSLKIEGRMKRPEYVYLVVSTFRKAIDSYYAGKSYKVDAKREEELMLMFNRGFSKGHIFHDDVKHRMSQYRPNHMGMTVGTVLSSSQDRVTVKLTQPIHQRDGLRILNEKMDIGLTAIKIWKKDKLVSEGNPGDIVQLSYKAEGYPKKGDKLQKTTDVALMDEIKHELDAGKRTALITMQYCAEVGKPLQLEVRDMRGNVVQVSSSQVIEEAKNSPIAKERLESSLLKLGDYPYTCESITGTIGNVFLPVSVINETRRMALEALNAKREKVHERLGEVPYVFHVEAKTSDRSRILVDDEVGNLRHMDGVEIYRRNENLMPAIHEKQVGKSKHSDCILSQIGDFNGEKDHCIAGMTLNIANSYAMAFMLSQPGVDAVIFSSECNDLQIHSALEAFEKRYGFVPVTYRMVYGRRTLMTIKDRFLSGEIGRMEDLHREVYFVKNHAENVEIIEPEVYHQSNPYCYGSYLIMNDQNVNAKQIEEEAYEEVFRRV